MSFFMCKLGENFDECVERLKKEEKMKEVENYVKNKPIIKTFNTELIKKGSVVKISVDHTVEQETYKIIVSDINPTSIKGFSVRDNGTPLEHLIYSSQVIDLEVLG